MTSVDEVLARPRAPAVPDRRAGMARYGIAAEKAYRVTVTELRTVAREIRRDHGPAAQLWETGVDEDRRSTVPGPSGQHSSSRCRGLG